MILQCPSCQARYLVQIGLFVQGGRQVRCARCKHEWHATLPSHIDVFKAPEPPVAPTPPFIPAESQPASAFATSPSAPISDPRAPAPNPIGETAKISLPAVIRKWRINFDWWKWDYLRIAAPYIAGLALMVALIAWPIIERQSIVRALPQLSPFYEAFGFDIDHNNMGLTFDQVKSEMHYDSGAMRLYVNGVIHNATSEAQLIPDIKARALGADRNIIQSWWVEAPAATVAAGGDVPFHTEVNAPTQRTIENVYLEFARDEKTQDQASGEESKNAAQ